MVEVSKLITTRQLSERLGVSRVTLTNWRKLGLPYIKLGYAVRYDVEDVMNWLDSHRK